MKSARVTDYTNQTSPKHFGWIKYLSQRDLKIRNYLSNVYKIGGAHVQCINYHYAKFKYQGMKTVGVTYYTS